MMKPGDFVTIKLNDKTRIDPARREIRQFDKRVARVTILESDPQSKQLLRVAVVPDGGDGFWLEADEVELLGAHS